MLALALCLAVSASAFAEKPKSRLGRIGRQLRAIARDGDSNLYLSGHAHHKRSVYGPELMTILNENAWGGGYGKSLRLADGSVASLAITAIVNSIDDREYHLGYMREWRWAPFKNPFELGAGFSAFLISRRDFFDGIPFPAVLPQLSVALKNDATLIATLIPRLPRAGANIGGVSTMNGDIVYFYARFKLP